MAKSSNQIRYAVVGQGHFAQAAVLPAFRGAKKNSRLSALISDSPKKLGALGKRYKVDHLLGYDDFDELIASGQIDAVYIALPNSMHCEFTVRAAEGGAHVLCEKPMAVTVDECEKMIAACEANRKKLMIAYRLHFEGASLEVAELVRKAKIGRARMFGSLFSFQVTPDNIRTKAELGGGPLHDIGVYCINAARTLFADEPIEVSAIAGGQGHAQNDRRFAEIDQQIAATLRFSDDRLASFVVSFGAASTGWFEIVGEKGSIRMDPAYEYAGGLAYTLKVGERAKTKKFKKRDQIAAEIAYFSDCIIKNREPEPSAKEGLYDIRVVEALLESARTGERISLAKKTRSRRASKGQRIDIKAHDEPPIVDAQAPTQD